MGELVNWITFIRNVITSLIFGLGIPYLLHTYVDPTGIVLDYNMMITNGIAYVIINSLFGLFRKETLPRFIIGIIYIVIVVYFYTVGYTIYTSYLPCCGFSTICLNGTLADIPAVPAEYQGITFAVSYAFVYTGALVIILKSVNLFRHLVKPPEEENKYKVAALKAVKLRKE